MTLPHRPAGVVFDMDGVLFDTERLARDALNSAGIEQGYPVHDALFQQMIGTPRPATNALLMAHFGADFPIDSFRAAWLSHYDRLVTLGPPLKPGLGELLDALDTWGLPRAIATSSGHETVEHHLAAHGLRARFDHVVASGDYVHGKPAPDPFLTAAARLGLAPAHCVALEDSHNGVRSACAAGMMTIMVPDLLEATPEMTGICARIAPDLHMVRTLIAEALAGPATRSERA
ncbi:MAG: HAD family phosphatase [Sphingobium sp.]